MKQVSLVLVSLLISAVSFAQLNAIIDNDSSYVWGDINSHDLVDLDVWVNNLDPDSIDLRWVRTEFIPAGWESVVCDAEACRVATTDSFDYRNPVGRGFLIVHFKPYKIMGEGSVSLKVKSIATGDFITATYFCKISAVGIKDVSVTSRLRIFPNPVRNEIKFANIGNYDLSSIEIYDLLGQRVMSFKAVNTRSSYSVDDLRAGMYFVRLLDKNKTPLITKKFNKQ